MKTKRMDFQIFYLLLSYGVWGLFWGGWGVLLPAVKSMIGASDAQLGTALLGITIGAVISMLGTGLIVKKFTKWALCGVLLYFAGSIAAVSLVDSVFMLGIVLFFVGSSSGMLDVIMNSGVATLESITGKHYFNYAHAAFPIAVIITSPTVGFARQSGINQQIILLVMAGIVALVGLLSLGLNIDQEFQQNIKEDKEKSSGSKILFTKAIFIFGFMGLLVHVMENAVEQWAAIYLEQHLLSAPTIASLGLTGYMGMLFIGRMAAQKINDYFSDKQILTISTLITVVGFLIATAAGKPILAIIGFSLAGLGIAPIVPIIFSLTGENTEPDKRVKAISSVTVVAYTGYLISPPLVGYISTVSSLQTAWFILTVVACLLVLMVRMIADSLYTGEDKQN